MNGLDLVIKKVMQELKIAKKHFAIIKTAAQFYQQHEVVDVKELKAIINHLGL